MGGSALLLVPIVLGPWIPEHCAKQLHSPYYAGHWCACIC